MKHYQRLRLSARVANLVLVRDFVQGACRRAGVAEDDCSQLVLAVDEACSNIVEHAYRGATLGTIQLMFEGDAEETRITIRDHGLPFEPAIVPTPETSAPWHERPIGGLGWHLIQQAVDDVRYDRDAEGNRLTLIKRASLDQDRARSEG